MKMKINITTCYTGPANNAGPVSSTLCLKIMNNIYSIILVAILLSLLGCDSARYTLKGTINHQVNGFYTPVSNAHINFECPKLNDKKTISDSNGDFVLEGIGFIDEAECVIHVDHAAYKDKSIKIDRKHLKGEKNLHPDYVIQISLEE